MLFEMLPFPFDSKNHKFENNSILNLFEVSDLTFKSKNMMKLDNLVT